MAPNVAPKEARSRLRRRQTDLEADRQVANTLAELIIGGALASTVISDQTHEDQGTTADGDPGEAA